MLRLKQALGAYILASTLLSTIVAQATTYYVATTGNNTNPGTEDQPWRTIGKAVDAMVAGDTAYVRGGTYSTETAIQFRRSGTATAPIKLLNHPGERPVIDWIDQRIGQTVLVQHSSGQNRAMGYITIEGFEIKNGYDGIKFYSMHNSVISRNWIHHNRNQGIVSGGGHHILFDRNIINHNGDFAYCARGGRARDGSTTCNKTHGIYVFGQSYTITNNLIYDNLGYGIQQNGSATSFYNASKLPSPDFAGASDWIIANNVLAYQNYRSGIVIWGSLCNNARIENNIFYENSQEVSFPQGVSFTATSCTGVQIRNNHAYATSPGGTAFLGTGATEGVHYTQSDNRVNISKPEFVNAPATLPASPNFALTAQSPAIDAGLPLATVKIDFTGTPRPQGRAPDIGAFEYTTGGDGKAPATPQALQVN
ncbi:MAG: right-handed parallel beta-helix repeat-containing protein [Nitrospira sp.]|nr:right-handed parallel beta-helix repeat-containing protein [Nitrospira sp.]